MSAVFSSWLNVSLRIVKAFLGGRGYLLMADSGALQLERGCILI